MFKEILLPSVVVACTEWVGDIRRQLNSCNLRDWRLELQQLGFLARDRPQRSKTPVDREAKTSRMVDRATGESIRLAWGGGFCG